MFVAMECKKKNTLRFSTACIRPQKNYDILHVGDEYKLLDSKCFLPFLFFSDSKLFIPSVLSWFPLYKINLDFSAI